MNCGESSPSVLVIGYGNPLRGDDGIGWHAAQRVEAAFPDPRVRILRAHQLLPEFAEDLSQAELAILIDASVDDAPGAWRCREVLPAGGRFDPHTFCAEQLLACARDLYGRCPRVLLYSIGAVDLSLAEELTAPVQAALDQLIEPLLQEIRTTLAG